MYFIFLLVNIIIAFQPNALAQIGCTTQLMWSTVNGKIMVNGQPLVLKGLNYFGFETETYAPHGLWSYSLDNILDFVKNNNFNAIRFPFAMDMVRNNPTKPNVDCNANPTICHLNALDLMNAVIDKCAERGILVMLDNQMLIHNAGIPELWYDNGDYSEATVMATWDILLSRFGTKWNFFAIDLKNEPHGQASWGKGVNRTDWNSASERFVNHFARTHPEFRGFFFVEGTDNNADGQNPNSPGHFWGENLEGVRLHPINTGNDALNSHVVYSPHIYGPDVFNMPYFQVSDFPQNMPGIWNMHFGYIKNMTGNFPIIPGEWGGKYASGSQDERWQNAFSSYLIANCMTNQFYWCLNPNSGDTGGLLGDDWTTPNTRKLQLLHNTQPNPTKFSASNGNICVTPGTFPNNACK
jgi:endoglucanase